MHFTFGHGTVLPLRQIAQFDRSDPYSHQTFDGIAEKIDAFRAEIIVFINSGRDFLGICLGMQLLFNGSEEGKKAGLGILDGEIIKFEGVQSPHMGWNTVNFKDEEMRNEFGKDPYFYFVHSYYLPKTNSDFEAAYTEHVGDKTVDFCSAVKKDNIWGVQFHPEKSGEVGKLFLELFKNSQK